MMILLITGMANLGDMVAVTVLITAERFPSLGERAAKVSGAISVVAGLVQVVRAAHAG